MKRVFNTVKWQIIKSIKSMHFNPIFFIVGQLLWPIITLGTLYLCYTPFMDEGDNFVNILTSNSSLWSFLLPGIIVLYLNGEYIHIGSNLASNRDYGVLEPIFLSPVNRGLWILGNSTSIIPSGLISIFSFLTVSHFIFRIEIPHLFLLLCSIIFVMFLSLGWGVFITSIFLIGRNSRVLYSLFESPAEFLSGTRFPIATLPGIIGGLSVAYPLSHGVKLVRFIWMENIDWSSVFKSSLSLLILSFIYFVSGYFIFKYAEYRGKRSGTLTFS